jgi:hypothetical protein
MTCRLFLGALAAASAPVPAWPAANYAAEIAHYSPGTGAVPGYGQTSAVLGEPSRIIPGDFGGAVDPFNAPWQPEQLLSLGAGGSLTIRFAEAVLDRPANPFGLDFLVFGNAAFVITNGDFAGGGITDGSLFGHSTGATRVSVSTDGVSFFTLDPARAPRPDHLFPTDGLGDFARPVDPALREADFAGRDLHGIRTLYGGSAGGVGYDLAWAQDADGRPVQLEAIDYVRIDVLSDRVEVDGFSAVPEPGAARLLPLGVLLILPALRRSQRLGS